MLDLATIFRSLQRQLFPALTEELGELSAVDKEFCAVISLTQLGQFTACYKWCGQGCPPHPRIWLAHAFIAKQVYQFPSDTALIAALRSCSMLRGLCGWDSPSDVPHESTFSRAFKTFARDQLPQRLHENMVKVHAGNQLVGHVSRDSTAIKVPEKPAPKPEPAPKVSAKRGRRRKGEVPAPTPPKRLELQPTRTLEENLADLPTRCNVGCKRNSKGHQESWIGYKLHLDTMDGDIPVSAVLTSASVHDSQVAIVLAQMTDQRVTSLYDLMDGAYDAPQIRDFSRRLGPVPIIAPNKRSGEKIPLDRAEAERFKERSASERVHSLLKQRYGARSIRVRGASKVMCHLMFGVIALTAKALWARIC
jgi:hypothetical protein